MATETEPTDLKSVPNLKISRSENPEIELSFEEVENLHVFDQMGNKIRFGDTYANQKTIVVFARHFLCYMCKEYVEDLAKIPLNTLKDKNVKLVVIGCAPWKFIKHFKQETGYQYDMYCDPDRNIYKCLKCKCEANHTRKVVNKHIKSNALSGILKSTWRAMQFPNEWQGDPSQMGATFILGPGSTVHFSHLDGNSADQVAINDLLIEAGCDTVDFEKDQRVLHV
ncbi:thioredoxin-like protein AAED1 isoform X1 [Lingula anatina]|uniref:Thioredoxin-like protein AAED1 isoform X1 n=2 Tax=Lingula anatina TaxID=7574 RepID=A0A1S3K3Z3_LINAN|nr:thioredoxin-like protein AAED1 isoform X1 [Lingula anatina]|eukprot:XP_013417353.1 thioredoxin-like protein AAED1 isoform X1 [Lingula anatina]